MPLSCDINIFLFVWAVDLDLDWASGSVDRALSFGLLLESLGLYPCDWLTLFVSEKNGDWLIWLFLIPLPRLACALHLHFHYAISFRSSSLYLICFRSVAGVDSLLYGPLGNRSI